MYPSDEETGLWLALNLAHRTAHRSIEAALKAKGLPALRWYDILWELEQAEEGLRPQELERRLVFEQSNLSRTLRRMVGEGLVDQTTHEGDRRGRIVKITVSGKEIRKRMWTVYGPLITENLRKIPGSHDFDAMAAALGALVDPASAPDFGPWAKTK